MEGWFDQIYFFTLSIVELWKTKRVSKVFMGDHREWVWVRKKKEGESREKERKKETRNRKEQRERGRERERKVGRYLS